MPAFLSPRLTALCLPAAAALALLVGCDRLGIGRGRDVAVSPPPPTVEPTVTVEPAATVEPDAPPARDPMPAPGVSVTSTQQPPVVETGTAKTAETVGGNKAPPVEPEPEAPLASDALDKPLDPPPEAKGLPRSPDPKEKGAFQDMWVDKENKRIVLAGRVCKRTGDMELFACFRRTKEHESIVSVRARAFAIHATLLVLGVKPGRPVQFFPEYRPPDGPEMEVIVAWTDDKGNRRTTLAQEWLHDRRAGRTMTQPWIFSGSGFWKDPEGEMHYMAEDGDFICVSNFASAMLDLPVSSSSANASLLFDAYTERIPPAGTPVALILQQRLPLEAPAAK